MKTDLLDIRNCDCIDLMAEYPDKHFDLAIVDPPYGINAESTAKKVRKNKLQRLNGEGGKLKNRILNTSKIDWDYEPPGKEYFNELFRVSKNQIIWGGNYFDLPPTRGIIVWDKCQPWENFSQIELAWTSFDKPAALAKFANTGCHNKEKKIHPTQKLVKLYSWLLTKRAEKGQKILDTHMGSGSIAIACHYAKCPLVACELDKDYYDMACERINNETKQLIFEF